MIHTSFNKDERTVLALANGADREQAMSEIQRHIEKEINVFALETEERVLDILSSMDDNDYFWLDIDEFRDEALESVVCEILNEEGLNESTATEEQYDSAMAEAENLLIWE